MAGDINLDESGMRSAIISLKFVDDMLAGCNLPATGSISVSDFAKRMSVGSNKIKTRDAYAFLRSLGFVERYSVAPIINDETRRFIVSHYEIERQPDGYHKIIENTALTLSGFNYAARMLTIKLADKKK